MKIAWRILACIVLFAILLLIFPTESSWQKNAYRCLSLLDEASSGLKGFSAENRKLKARIAELESQIEKENSK